MKKNIVGLKNHEMNSEIFKLRKRVLSFVYEAKKLLPEFEHVEIRITEKEDTPEGQKPYAARAHLGKKHISVLKDVAETANDLTLRGIIFHELVHTLFGVRHIESCPLMKGGYNPNLWDGSLSIENQNELLLKYYKKYKLGDYNTTPPVITFTKLWN